jgi:hypothetical protein
MVTVIVLIVLNIPVFLFLAWVAFDSRDQAAQTFGETIVAILQIILVPKIIRVLWGMDDEGALGILPIAGYFIACAALVAAEYWLLTRLFPNLA